MLYEKHVSGKGRTTYIPHVPPDPRKLEIPQEQIVTLLTTLTLSMLMSVEEQLPDHARAAREIKNVETALVRLAKLNAQSLDPLLVEVGVAAWNAAMYSMQKGVAGGAHA